MTNLVIDFKDSYFIPGEAYVKNYLDKTDIYYKTADTVTFYTDGMMDFSKEQA